MAKRAYQVWQGSNKFFLGGRLIFGPDVRSVLLTLFLILAPLIIFFAIVVKLLLHKFIAYNAGYAILGVSIAFTIYVLVLLLLISTQDPGIVPRSSHPPEEESDYESSLSIDFHGKIVPTLLFPRTKEVFVNGLLVRVKFCETCLVYRLPRCSHCSVCDNCVERFDHHCPWVGQCIGKRNYRCFFLFITSLAIFCIFIFSMSALYLKLLMDVFGTFWEAVKESPASLILMVYCFVLLWFVGGLSCFHAYLICTNQTTYEFFRYRDRFKVYDRGCGNNFLEILCTKVEPSKHNFRAYVEEEEQHPPNAPIQEALLGSSADDMRIKVQDGLDIGHDLLQISQHREIEEVDIRSRGSNKSSQKPLEIELDAGLEQQVPTSWTESHHSSLNERNERKEI